MLKWSPNKAHWSMIPISLVVWFIIIYVATRIGGLPE